MLGMKVKPDPRWLEMDCLPFYVAILTALLCKSRYKLTASIASCKFYQSSSNVHIVMLVRARQALYITRTKSKCKEVQTVLVDDRLQC